MKRLIVHRKITVQTTEIISTSRLSEVFVTHTQVKTRFFFYTFTLFLCLNSFFVGNTAAQIGDEPVIVPPATTYTFETIDVPGVDFLAVTASDDFGNYAGYTRGADGEKIVGFTLIGEVFTIHDFPGSQITFFYALGNN